MKMISKKVKIVATIGPASNNSEIIKKLLLGGVNVFRLNFSHGTHEAHKQAINTIRQQSKILGVETALLADLQGPKIRTGITPEDKPVNLKSGTTVILTSEKCVCTNTVISVDFKDLSKSVNKGQLVMINDGAACLQIEKINADETISCRVLSGGMYSSHKGVNFPNVDLPIPSMTTKDKKDLSFILQNDIQYVALSFVRSAEDIKKLRKLIVKYRNDLKIIAKIEKPEAAKRIEEILSVADGIMVARGDLGVEMSVPYVPIVQKQIIESANRLGKLVIVATQMLESMIKSSIPTRAESTDVANAVIDGTDAVMLSGETATGDFPVETVKIMTNIVQIAESSDYVHHGIIDLAITNKYPPNAICEAANWACRDLGGIPVCVFTISGNTAFYMSKIRCNSPIFVFTPDIQVQRQLALAWNVYPFLLAFSTNIAELYVNAEKILLKDGYVKNGDLIALVSGSTPIEGATNSLRIKKVGEK
jgi:pyruvate kinase